jgi:hypothetical protein
MAMCSGRRRIRPDGAERGRALTCVSGTCVEPWPTLECVRGLGSGQGIPALFGSTQRALDTAVWLSSCHAKWAGRQPSAGHRRATGGMTVAGDGVGRSAMARTSGRRSGRCAGLAHRRPGAGAADDRTSGDRAQISTAVPQIPQTSSCRRPHRTIGTKNTVNWVAGSHPVSPTAGKPQLSHLAQPVAACRRRAGEPRPRHSLSGRPGIEVTGQRGSTGRLPRGRGDVSDSS